MAAVRMYIDKFGGAVLIDERHPLAVAQRATSAPVPVPLRESEAHTADGPSRESGVPPAAPVAPASHRKRR